MEQPRFTYDDVKYADDPAMFARAEVLFRDGKVGDISEDFRGYNATVAGTSPYFVSVSKNYEIYLPRKRDSGYNMCNEFEH